MMRHSKERWGAGTVTRRGPSLTDLVLVMVVKVVRMVRVVNVAQVRADVRSQLLVRPGLHLCWLVKVRFHTFLESIRLLTLSLSLSLSLSVHTVVQLVLAAGWGDAHWVGLTGVELLHAEGHTLPLTTQQVQVRLSVPS